VSTQCSEKEIQIAISKTGFEESLRLCRPGFTLDDTITSWIWHVVDKMDHGLCDFTNLCCVDKWL